MFLKSESKHQIKTVLSTVLSECFPYTQECRALTGVWTTYQGRTPKENSLLLPQRPSTVDVSLIRGGASWAPPHFVLDFGPANPCTGLTQATAAAVSRRATIPSCLDHVLLGSFSTSQAFFPNFDMFPDPRRKGVDIDVPFTAEHGTPRTG